MELNPYQWGKTRSALSWMLELVKNRKTKFDDVRKYLIEEEITYVEKFDGTNIGKDKNGCIYTRRTKLNKHMKEFIGTSLKNVKKIEVNSFHDKMNEIVYGGVKNTIVFGELMCNNNIHDYGDRGLNARWILFGAVLLLEDDKDVDEYLEKLKDTGFVVKKMRSLEICIYLNEKLAGIFEKLAYDCPMVKRSTIFNMMKENKRKIISGEIEGVVILTDIGSYTGYLKWKGAHYKQPVLEQEIRVVNECMKNNENYHDDIKIMFKWFVEIFDCETENKYCKDIKKSSDKYFYIINAMRDAQKKFDSKFEDLEEYISQIIREVKEHATREELNGVEINDEIENYMREKLIEQVKCMSL